MTTVDYPEPAYDWCASVEEDSWWFQHRNRVLVDQMRRFPPAMPLYDIGGGNGVVAVALREAGIQAIVVEPGHAAVCNARARGLQVIPATLCGAGLTPASVGSLALFDVVEHIQDDSAFLAEAFTRLRPGGRLYLTVPAYQSLWSAADTFSHHFRRYTARTLRRVLRKAGFKMEHSSYMFAFLPLPILLFRTIPHRLGHARPASARGMKDDHGGSSLVRATLDRMLGAELRAMRLLGSLPFGGSVVSVAQKPVN